MIAVLLAAILTLLAYGSFGKAGGLVVLGIVAIGLPIALFPIKP